MNSISTGMASICEEIVSSYAERRKALKGLKAQTKDIQANAQKFVGDCQKAHKEMARNLKETLTQSREDLTGDVDSLRRGFRKAQKEVRQDLEAASKAWSEMQRTK